MGLQDKGINDGLTRYLPCGVDTSDLVYDYTFFMDKKGSVLIMRALKDFSEVRYYQTKGDFATIVAAKGTYGYVLPLDVIEPTYEKD